MVRSQACLDPSVVSSHPCCVYQLAHRCQAIPNSPDNSNYGSGSPRTRFSWGSRYSPVRQIGERYDVTIHSLAVCVCVCIVPCGGHH